MVRLILSRSVFFTFFAYFMSFVGILSAGDATLTLDDNAGSSSFIVQDSDKTNQFKVNSDGQGYFSGNVGIGTTDLTGFGKVAVHDVSGHSILRISNDANATYHPIIYFAADRDGVNKVGWVGMDNDNNLMKIIHGSTWAGSSNGIVVNSSGNVGIGTTNPLSPLSVQANSDTGHPSPSNNEIDAMYFYKTAGQNFLTIQHPSTGGNHASNIYFKQGANWVFRISAGWNGSPDQIMNLQNNAGLAFATTDASGTGERVRITNSGNVGIGTTAPTEKLEVSGNIKASGTVSQGSSREFKKNISSVSTKDAIKALNKLNPVRFEYKTDDSGEKHLGFIAEDVPDLVAEEDRKHLNSMDITAVLTKVVQEQQRQIQEQQKVISNLLNEVREIKGKI